MESKIESNKNNKYVKALEKFRKIFAKYIKNVSLNKELKKMRKEEFRKENSYSEYLKLNF